MLRSKSKMHVYSIRFCWLHTFVNFTNFMRYTLHFFIWFTQLDLLTMYVYLLKLAKMYAKYQEVVDALRHEQLGRKESEAVLQRVWLTWRIFFLYNLKRLIWQIISLMFCLVYLVLICKMDNKEQWQGMGGCNDMNYYLAYHLYASM